MCSRSILLLRKRVVKLNNMGEAEIAWRRIARRRKVNGREARGRLGIAARLEIVLSVEGILVAVSSGDGRAHV